MFVKLNLKKIFKMSPGFLLLVISYSFIFICLGLLNANQTLGQTSSSSVKGGKAAGTYTLDNFDNINLFNGNLNFNLPLITLNGRGEAGATVPLTLETRWKLINASVGQNGQYYYEPETLAGVMVNGPGKLVASVSTYQYYETSPGSCGQAGSQPQYAKLILNFTTSNGTSHQLRSTQNNGAPYIVPYCYPGLPGIDHGTEFISWDGSGVKFVSDTSVKSMVESFGNLNGYLLMPSGTRFRISGGLTIWIEDRNGNRTTFSYYPGSTPEPANTGGGQGFISVRKIIDSNGREIDFQYNLNASPYGAHTKITYKGFSGNERTIRISYKNLQEVLRPDQLSKSIGALFPGAPSSQATDFPLLTMVSDVWLPDGRKYSFLYGSYAQLARVNLPTGGAYEYDYVPYSPPQPQPNPMGAPYLRVTERRVYPDGINLSQKISFNDFVGGTTVDTYNQIGQRLSRSKHYFHGDPRPPVPPQGLDVFEEEDPWNKGREYKTENYSSDGTTLLRITETEWGFGRYAAWNPYGTGNTNIYRDARVVSKTNFLADSGQISKSVYGYDSTVNFNLQTDVYEYDYGNGAPSNLLLRRTHTEFEKGAIYTNNAVNLVTLPKEAWISSDIDGNNIVSRTKFEYDNYASGPYTATLLERPTITGHNPAYGTSYKPRGNVTKVTTFADAQNQTGAVSVHTQYDIAGNIVKNFDAKGQASNIGYNDNFGAADAEAKNNSSGSIPNLSGGRQTFAFPTSAKNVAGYTTYAQFDYYSGAGVDSEDINGNVSTTFYDDALDRPTQTISANNRPHFRRQTTFVYDDVNRKVIATTDSKNFGDNLIKSEAFYDGLARTFETREYENATDYKVILTEFDSLGRAYKSSNPYRPYLNEQPNWTTTSYDDLGRVSEVKSPDNGKIRREYWGTAVRIFDQANRSRAGVSDALGRLTKVVEYDEGADLETLYTYDVSGRLRKTSQGGQNRYFMYDDLGRLIRARQPEQNANPDLDLPDPITGNSVWAVKYEYDDNGNVISTTDARNIKITGTYDNLNRLTARNYSDTTPDVNFTFDNPNVQNSKGQLTAVVSNDSANYYKAFDELGRVKSSSQVTNGQIYDFPNYIYDLSGALVEQTYPSGRVVKTESDNIGRLSRMASRNPGQSEKTYLSNLAYTAFGAVSRARLGNGRWESMQFDAKTMQVTQIGLGYSNGNTSQLKIEYNYGTTTAAASDNNGSLRQQIISYAGQTSPIIQNYTYDMLNRLKSATENVNGSQTWKQTFLYDRFGNRRFDAANTTTLIADNGVYNPSIDVNTNRFLVTEGYNYDAEGNLTGNPENQLFQYDANNRQIRVTGAASQNAAHYYYDGNGKRVRKVVDQEETIFVYDAFGKLVAEYATTIDNSRPKTTSYLTTDSVGSPRVITDGGGNVISRHDYLPFGEEIAANVGGRMTTQGYQANDGVRKQFTGYERDAESGLDYAQARYFSSRHGRFTSVDPLTASANMKNPQTFNRYSYALNSPYKFTDPLGLAATQHCWGNICSTYDADERADRENGDNDSPVTSPENIKPTVVIPETITVLLNGQRIEVVLPPAIRKELQKIAESFEQLQSAYETNRDSAIKFGRDVVKKLEEERVASQGLFGKIGEALFGASAPPAQQVSVTNKGQVVVPTEWSNTQQSSSSTTIGGEVKAVTASQQSSGSSSQTANVKSTVAGLAAAANSQLQQIEKQSVIGPGNLYSTFRNTQFTIAGTKQKTGTMTKSGWEQLYNKAMMGGINAAGNRPGAH
jgi:RHS repeat-associated protein